MLVAPYRIFSKLVAHPLTYLYVHSILNEWSYRLLKSRKLTRWMLLFNLIYDKKKLTDELLEKVCQAGLDPFAGKAFTSFQRSELTFSRIRSDFTDQLSSIQAPTLLIQGTDDPFVLPKHALHAHQQIPHSELQWFEHCKHWP